MINKKNTNTIYSKNKFFSNKTINKYNLFYNFDSNESEIHIASNIKNVYITQKYLLFE